VYPTGKESLLAPGYLASFNACPLGTTSGPTVNGAPCTPVLSAQQAGLPEGLRTTTKRIVPRFGFAYRPFSNDNTVVRGGFGMHTVDLVYAPNLNQSYYSTEYFAAQPLSQRPFPNWGTVNNRSVGANAKYNSFQTEVNHRFSSGLTFNSAYTWAKNLADNQGP